MITDSPQNLTRVKIRYSMWRSTWSPKELNVKVPLPRHLQALRAHYRHVLRVPELGPLRNSKARDCLMSVIALAGTDWQVCDTCHGVPRLMLSLQVFSALSNKLTAAVKRPAALSAVLPALLHVLSDAGKYAAAVASGALIYF
jgi:hypothetical protein